MMKHSVIFLCVLAISFLRVAGQEGVYDRALREEVSLYGQAEVLIDYPGRNSIDYITRKVSIVGSDGKTVRISLSFATVEWFINQKFEYRIADRPEMKGLTASVSAGQASDWQSYPSYTDYLTIMQGFETTYPGLCQLDTIGTSINGKLVLVLKISDNPLQDEDEPEVFYTSTMHGDEIVGFVLMMRLADSLLSGYATSDRIKSMVDTMEIWINPLSNPDGAYYGGNTISSPTRYNANGVDLNRNFPDPLDPSIVPEKENIDMIKFLRQRRFILSANFHSGAEVLNYPWDRWYFKFHADDSWFIDICRSYADTIHKYYPTGYMTDLNNGITRGSEWYIIYGGRQDFVTSELQGREVTIELDVTKLTPASQLDLHWQYNRLSLIKYLENAMFGIHGYIKDKSNQAPVAARIFVNYHDKDSSHVYSDSLTGRFARMLYPSTYSLLFTASGYKDTTVNDVTVVTDQRTDLIVQMEPLPVGTGETDFQALLLYPNPVKETLMCLLPENFSGLITYRIYDLAGRIVGDNMIYYGSGPVAVKTESLPAGSYFIVISSHSTGKETRGKFIVTEKR